MDSRAAARNRPQLPVAVNRVMPGATANAVFFPLSFAIAQHCPA